MVKEDDCFLKFYFFCSLFKRMFHTKSNAENVGEKVAISRSQKLCIWKWKKNPKMSINICQPHSR